MGKYISIFLILIAYLGKLKILLRMRAMCGCGCGLCVEAMEGGYMWRLWKEGIVRE
jgi:hypothetical protein